MQSLVLLTRDPIPQALSRLPAEWSASEPGVARGRSELTGPVGAWLDFYGIVRGFEAKEEVRPVDPIAAGSTSPPREPDLRAIHGIDYEAHEAMAQHQLEALITRICARYPIEAMLVLHRIGPVPVGEPSLLVRILTAHRGEALRACADFIDELKQWVPIWKHPQWT